MAEPKPLHSGNGAPAPLPDPPDTREFIQVLREKVLLVLAVTLGAFLVGRYYAYHSPLIYQAKAVLQVEQELPKLVSLEEMSRQDLRDSDALNTIVKKINRSEVLLRVVRSNNLVNHPAFSGTNHTTEKEVVRRLASLVESRLQPGTRLIDVTVHHANPELAQELANSVATNFIRLEWDQRLISATSGNETLEREAAKLKKKLEVSEKALQEYKVKNQTVSFEEGKNSISETLSDYSRRHSQANAERVGLQTDLGEINKVKDNPEALLNIASVYKDPAIAALREKVMQEEAQVATLTNKWKPKYPKMRDAQTNLVNLKEQLKDLILKSPVVVQSSYENALAREKNLETELNNARAQELALMSNAIPYNILHGNKERDKLLYESVSKRLTETDLTKSIENHAITLIEPASLPVKHAKPNRPQIMLISVLSGLLVSLTFIFITHRFDTSIKTVDQAEKTLNLPVLGAIPIDKGPKVKLSPLVMVNEPHSICAESFRSLRATLGMLGRDSERRVFLFTSAIPAEGKTFSCVNYALCQAQQGQRTLLIDFDLRRPTVASSFSLPSDTPGVSDYLLGKDSFANLVRLTNHANLSILTAGPKVPNPAEQLTGGWVKQLLAEAQQAFDRIIIDTPPLNAISDTLYLLSFAQVICLVVRAGITPKKAVKRAIETMHRANAYPSGIVLNCLPERSGYGYYYYYSTPDGYRSKGVYGATFEKVGASR